jgi:hypothetical protein
MAEQITHDKTRYSPAINAFKKVGLDSGRNHQSGKRDVQYVPSAEYTNLVWLQGVRI